MLRDALVLDGALLITDHCAGEHPWSACFADYVARRGYHLVTPAALGATMPGRGSTR